MRITVESECAIRIMLFLSMRGVDVKTGAKMISEHENVPIRFALKILRKLKLAGFIKSYRGQAGGYALLKEPTELSLKDVIETIDGPIVMNKCLCDEGVCDLNRMGECPVHFYMYKVQNLVSDSFQEVTFDKLIDKYVQVKNNVVSNIQGLG